MVDLLDQYDTVELGGYFTAPQIGQQPAYEPISSGFVTVSSDDEQPMFQRKLFNFKAQEKIIDVAVSNNIMVIALYKNIIKRFRLNDLAEVDTMEISKRTDDQIHRIFLDPSGQHLLVAMKSQESYYLGRSMKKPRALQKLKNFQIDAVAWNKANRREPTTGPILLGTNKGLVLETEVDSEEKFTPMAMVAAMAAAEKHVRQIFNVNEDLKDEVIEPITGLHFEAFPSLERKFFVMVTTPSRLYQFVGDIGMESPVFAPVLSVYGPDPTPFLELRGMLGYSNQSLFFSRGEGLPKSFAWLTGLGVYCGRLDFSRHSPRDSVAIGGRLLPSTELKPEAPISICATEFHCLLLYSNKVEGVCTLNDEEDFSEVIPAQYGPMTGMVSDIFTKVVWIFSESNIFQITAYKESRHVWKMYLDRNEFELAKDYCKDNPAQMDLVFRKQASHLFEEKLYQQAAAFYALTQISFEEVALKFIHVQDSEALKMFLLKKFVNLKPNDKTQMVMLVTWLIELFLNQLGEFRDRGDATNSYEMLKDEFRKFLNQTRVKVCLEDNKHVAYDLFSSHGDTENMIFFAMIMQDYQRVISYHIQQDDFAAALDVLKKQKEDYRGLFERFSPVLMPRIPKQLVEVWKQRDLDPKKLIPALVTHEQSTDDAHINHAIDYLEHCVFKLLNKAQVIHNYLISLYCKMPDEAPLLRYLNGQGEDPTGVSYDLKYALRLCSEHGKNEAAVLIYSTMGLYEEAVELALTVDIDKAKIYADKPEHDDALRKKLWLKVARHVVEQKQNIERAMELLKECPLLKIEDVLPFFPDFVTIDQFKDAICESLEQYNQQINQLKADMQEATETAKLVRAEIHEVRNRYGTISAQEKCSVCYYPLLTRSFYYFPCSHVFHADCLIKQVTQNMKEKQRLKVEELQSKLSSAPSVSQSAGTSSAPSSSVSTAARDQLKLELDELVAAECLYCGDAMIRSLDKPFIEDEDFANILQSWS